MFGGVIGEGAVASLGRDPALVPVMGQDGERRRNAKALALWIKGRRASRLPRLSHRGITSLDGDGAEALFEFTAGGVRLLKVDPRLDREPAWPDLVLDQIVSRLSAIQVQQTPLGFEAEAWTGASAVMLRGLLLPFADERGMLRYVKAIVGWRTVASSSKTAAVALEIGQGLADEARAAGLVRRSGDSVDERLAVARTWAALAMTDAVTRAVSLDAALSAIFDAMLAIGDATAVYPLVDEVLADICSVSERRSARLALIHGMRLGLEKGDFGPLLAHYPGGAKAMARIELWLQRYERRDWRGVERPVAVRMRLTPIAADWIRPERHDEARHPAEGTPWSRPISAAA